MEGAQAGDVVAWGEFDIHPSWAETARTYIDRMNADNGFVCANWD